MKRRFLAVLLCLLMVGQMLPVSAWAATRITGSEIPTSGRNSLSGQVTSSGQESIRAHENPGAQVTSKGYCGLGEGRVQAEHGATWTMVGGSKLVIGGSGPVRNYSLSAHAPWYAYREAIQTVEIGAGITFLGDAVFYNCIGLTSVTIPDRVTSIGAEAFSGCYRLKNVTIPAKVSSIKDGAFNGCTGLTDVYYGGTQEQWEALEEDIADNNEYLLNAAIHFGGSAADSFEETPETHLEEAPAAILAITFKPNGGEGIPVTIAVTEGQSTKLPANSFTRTGYTFTGWNTAANGSGTAYKERASLTPERDLTLFAQWTQIITLKPGQIAEPTNLRWATEYGTYTDESGTYQVSPGCLWFDDTVNTGEVFYYVELSKSDGSFNITSTTAESVGFKTSKKGTFYVDSGFSANDLQTGSYRFRVTAGNPQEPDKKSAPAYSDVWSYTRPSAKLAVPAELRVRGSKVIWNTVPNAGKYEWIISYSKTADGTKGMDDQRYKTGANGGTSEAEGDASEYISGHGAGYYYICVRALSGDITKIRSSEWSNVILVYSDGSTFEPADYILTFAPNGGSGSMETVTVTPGHSVALPANTFSRSGCKFSGWNTAADGSGTSFAEGASLTPTDSLILFAQWEQRTAADTGDYAILDRIPDMYQYEDQIFRVDASLSEFEVLALDGNELTEGIDYTTAEGGASLLIPAETFRIAGEGAHTIVAAFRDRNGVLQTAEQDYTVDLSGTTTLNIDEVKDATKNVAYSAAVEAIPHYEDLRFKIVDGSLPDGWELDEVTGIISGTPQESDVTYTFTIGVSHEDGEILSQAVVSIQAKTSRQFIVGNIEVHRPIDYIVSSPMETAYEKALSNINKGAHEASAVFVVHSKEEPDTKNTGSQDSDTDEKPIKEEPPTVPAPPTSYTIHLKQVTGGTVRASATSAPSGTKVTLTVTPNEGYVLKSVKVSGTTKAGDVSVTKSGNKYTFIMPGKQVTVTPSFGPASRRVAVTASEHGKLTVNQTNVKPGAKVTITAHPDNGYVIAAFSAWDAKGKYLTVKNNGNGTATFTMPESAVQVGARFELDPGLPVTDIRPADWFYEDARWAYRRSIMTGVTGTAWVPEDRMSTATAVVTLARLAGADLKAYQTENWISNEENDGSYNWIPNEWYAAEARWAAVNYILTEDVYTGREVLPRANLAIILRRFLAQQGVVPSISEGRQAVFSDAEAIRSFGPEAEEAFRILYEIGVFRGDSTKAMLPGAATKRSHLAATLHRLSEYIISYWDVKGR